MPTQVSRSGLEWRLGVAAVGIDLRGRTAERYIALWEGRTKLVRGQPTENATEGPDTRVGNAETETLKARIKELEDELEWAREELELETPMVTGN